MWREVVNAYAGSPIDRRNNFRKDEGMIAASEDSACAMTVVLDNRFRLLSDDGGLVWVQMRDLGASSGKLTAFLGDWMRNEGETWSCFAVQVALSFSPNGLKPGCKFSELRGLTGSGKLSTEENTIAAHAKSLLEFHAKHQFCGICGSKTVSEMGSSRRRCTRNLVGEEATPDMHDNCPGMWFPRTDPVVIAVIVDGDRCLLGRKAVWPQGVFSALAGFMEHGESCEDAVRREVFEEAGVRVGTCRYHSSQPWPFPYSLMVGFLGKAESAEITVDLDELETARWFSRDEVLEMIKGDSEFKLPPPMAIANRLCMAFAENNSIASFD
mmetsp:Transcript_33779/g.132757  ORF Transcript_33779/g.132757 Transcript_33779/m.132757 type:complete len:326 (-) Transcript_33779:815-1792(-)|eukprot:CAMPEP_0113958576 /NCGR_PEP_ID=MMETSP0011_2-20120614/3537_1 /TAXON_ID=101924 /ORGANISM="Rhodosorus marinus" /LENGTH=325 /DNA_ID=CAMNT_0000969535 /DNA_START=228 /DNA_END=1205 /DNA_ORIENTATION=- /assembly_acc=CAM_ASM_000156